jgi:holliday junction DNA helicase RuvA
VSAARSRNDDHHIAMIGRIEGQLVEIADNVVLVAVGGVGYELEITQTALSRLPPRGQPVSFHTHFVVREDAQQLYGFVSRTERELFREFIRINGVGPRLALSLLSSIPVEELARAVQAKDAGVLLRVPGVGRKTAERLLIELSGKLPAVLVTEPARASAGAVAEAERALVALGYRPAEAARMIGDLNDEAQSTEDLVRAALRRIARSAEAAS